MSSRRPSRIALAVFDCFIADNDPLRGDLIEEFDVRRSQFWLWRQVFWAVAFRPWPHGARLRGELQLTVLAGAMLALLAFQAVFVTNAIYRFLFAPTQDIRGYMYHLLPLFTQLPEAFAPPDPLELWRAIIAIVTSLPIGWFIARVREHHRVAALAAFSVSITLCAALNLQIGLPAQLLTTICFIVGLLVAGTIATAADARSSAA